MFYTKRPFLFKYQNIILYLIPLLLLTYIPSYINNNNNNNIILLILIIITIFYIIIYLLTRWFIKILLFLNYKKILFPDFKSNNLYIFYNEMLLKVNNNTFKYLNEVYYINYNINNYNINNINNNVSLGLVGNNINRFKIEKVYIKPETPLSEMLEFISYDITKYNNISDNNNSNNIIIPVAIAPHLYINLPNNTQKICNPDFIIILIDHLLSPFFILSFISSVLWLFEGFIYTTITNIILSALTEVGNAYQKYLNLCVFSKDNEPSYDLSIVDMQSFDIIGGGTNSGLKYILNTENIISRPNYLLKPGDTIILKEADISNLSKFPCDALLLCGSVIVNESLLTGESHPVCKVCLFDSSVGGISVGGISVSDVSVGDGGGVSVSVSEGGVSDGSVSDGSVSVNGISVGEIGVSNNTLLPSPPTRPSPSADKAPPSLISASADIRERVDLSASVAATDNKLSVGNLSINREVSPSPALAGSVALSIPDDKSSGIEDSPSLLLPASAANNKNNALATNNKKAIIASLKSSTIYKNSTIISFTKNTKLLITNIGFSTESGNLIKKIINKETININYKDCITFILLLLFIGTIGCIYLISNYIKQYKFKQIIYLNKKISLFCLNNIYKVPNLKKTLLSVTSNNNDIINNILKCNCYKIFNIFNINIYFPTIEDLIINILSLLTNIIPCELPIQMALSINSCVSQLLKYKIYVVEPLRLENAGNVDIICLDKTGTITEDMLVVKYIWLNDKLDEVSLVALSGCNELSLFNGKLIGDPIDSCISEYLETYITNNNSDNNNNSNNMVINYEDNIIKIIKKYPFDSLIKKQGCLIEVNNKKRYLVFKGAREEILKMCNLSEPCDLLDNKVGNRKATKDTEVYKTQCQLGYRVLAFCYKEVNIITNNNISNNIDYNNNDYSEGTCHRPHTPTQADTSNNNMKYGGLIIMENPIKPSTIETINTLKNIGYKIIMITGDSKLTSCSIASKVGILTNSNTSNNNIECVDGLNILKLLNNSAITKNLLLNIKVFSRVSPHLKQLIIKTYQAMGLNCMMVGDGTNDVGALREAKVGIALLTSITTDDNNTNTTNKKTQEDLLNEKIIELKSYLGLLTLPETNNNNNNANNNNIIGDASIAAPISTRYGFKTISLILSFGRSLKITNLQMYKILSINSVIFALFWILDSKDIKFGDKQMVVTSLLLSFAFMSLSFQRPIDFNYANNINGNIMQNNINCNKSNKLIKCPKINSFYTFTTIILQIIVHIITFYITFTLFDKRNNYAMQIELLNKIKSICSPTDLINTTNTDYNNDNIISTIKKILEFQPSNLNTIFFILTQYLQIQTFYINYIGHPFRESLFENKKLFLSLSSCFIFLFIILFGLNNEINSLVECVVLGFKDIFKIVLVLGCNFCCCFLIEFLCLKFLI
ncbi:putative manganese-transporting ATPase PDR2 [Cucumispora dikerogammari]|nr:putative manganese-transporting ATPase PDR2 [Cucumispora dikerogammari]